MAASSRSGVDALGDLPALTVGNLAIALLAIPAFVLLASRSATEVGPFLAMALQVTVGAVVVGVAVGAEGLSLSEIGFRRPAWIDLGYLLATSVAILAVYILTTPLVEALGLSVRQGGGAMGAGAGVTVAVAQSITTGIVEEVLYRGYPIEWLLASTDSPLLAGGLTWAVFAAVHAVSWPLGNVLQTTRRSSTSGNGARWHCSAVRPPATSCCAYSNAGRRIPRRSRS